MLSLYYHKNTKQAEEGQLLQSCFLSSEHKNHALERDSDILSDPRQDKPNTAFHHSDEGENYSVDKEVSEEVLPTGW